MRRILAAVFLHAGDWLLAPPITSVGPRLGDEMIRIAVVYRFELRTCEPHTCSCGKYVDARGLHGLSCRRSSARQQRHAQLNDVIWRAIKRAQISVAKRTSGTVSDRRKTNRRCHTHTVVTRKTALLGRDSSG